MIHIILLLAVAAASFPSRFKTDYEFMMGVAEKMPAWDADKLGAFEREQIATVKTDIMAAEQESDPDEFLIDIQQLHKDVDALQALDDSLNRNRVI